MTGLYLEKLRALKSQKGAVEALSKPSKRSPQVEAVPTTTPDGGFEGFEGTQSTGFADFGTPVPNRYGRVFAALEAGCPDLVPVDRWQLAVVDGRRFVTRWGNQAEAFGWTPRDLFGLHRPPAKPHPSYSRLSRYDETGLIWLLCGREVVALTEATAAIQSSTGAIIVYRRFNKLALGPVGDSLDDLQ
jgi:hypothetical protein